MTEDQAVELLRRQWGVQKAPPSLLVSVSALIRLAALAQQAISYSQGYLALTGDDGRQLRLEFDRLQRTLNHEVTDIFR